MNCNLLVVGVGGPGVMTAAEVLARAAFDAGFDVTKTEVAGMSQRGGVVCSQVRIGRVVHAAEIEPGTADLLLALEAAELLRWCHWLKMGGDAVVNTARVVPPIVDSGLARYPADPAGEARNCSGAPRATRGLPSSMPRRLQRAGNPARETRCHAYRRRSHVRRSQADPRTGTGMRIGENTTAGLPWYLRPLFWLQRRRWGQVLLPALTWARVPPYYLALTSFHAAIERRNSPLEPALRSLLQVRVSQLTHCAFCMDINAALAADRSGSMAKALAVSDWRSSTLFSARESPALQYAEEITSGEVSNDTSARISHLFGENGLVELTGLIAFQNMSARFNAALDLPAQGFCRIADHRPAPLCTPDSHPLNRNL